MTYGNGTVFMDRNLGAAGTTAGGTDAYGMYYQWGRKDPFYGGEKTETSANAFLEAKNGTVVNPAYPALDWAFSKSATTTDGAAANPMTFYNDKVGTGYNWLASPNATLWGEAKTLNDPCPPGYRVPGTGAWEDLISGRQYIDGVSVWDGTNYGMTYTHGGQTAWYPAQGYRNYSSGAIVGLRSSTGGSGAYWSAETSSVKSYYLFFRGIVIAVDDGDLYRNKYTVCDFGWHLNKSKETYQFNNMNAKKAVIHLCSDFNIPIDSVPELNTSITQIYIDKCISDILSDILDKCGDGYNFDMTPNGIRIYKYGEIYAYPEFRITPNTRLIYSPTLKGSVSHSLSIEDMKNSVKVITESDKVYTVKAVTKDADSIYKYGVLQDVFKIDEKDGDANTYAKNKLAELNKIKESFSIEIIEAMNSYTRAGMLITVDNINYLIESADHSIKNGVHYVKLGLRKFG